MSGGQQEEPEARSQRSEEQRAARLWSRQDGRIWETAHQRAFDKLKCMCAAAPVLALPSEGAELVMRCGASREAMGVALYQRDHESYLQTVEFKSKSFEASQQRLVAHDRETLELLFGLKSFRHFLLGRSFKYRRIILHLVRYCLRKIYLICIHGGTGKLQNFRAGS